MVAARIVVVFASLVLSLEAFASELPRQGCVISAIRRAVCGLDDPGVGDDCTVTLVPDAIERLTWTGVPHLVNTRDVYRVMVESDGFREPRLALVSEDCKVRLVAKAEDLDGVLPDPRTLDDKAAMSLGIFTWAASELDRLADSDIEMTSEWPLLAERQFGCTVLMCVASSDLCDTVRTELSLSSGAGPHVQRANNGAEVSFLCVYHDLAHSLWQVTVKLHPDAPPEVSVFPTGFRLEDGRRLARDHEMYFRR